MMRRFVVAVLVQFMLGSPAAATVLEGVRFSERHTVAGEQLELSGVGLKRYQVFLKGYVAALYLREASPANADGVLGDVPRRIEIQSLWSIDAERFAKATRDGIAKNVDAATLATIQTRIEQITQLFEDVKPGDRYAITYLPGVGTELSLNGVTKGIVEGADFASALFSIWLGPSSDETLKTQLLGSL